MRNVTLPLGVMAELNLEGEPQLRMLEPAVYANNARWPTVLKQKHIHLIGICGTAMASLAGMLQLRGTGDGVRQRGLSADERPAK